MGKFSDYYQNWINELQEYYVKIYNKIETEARNEAFVEYCKFYDKKINEIFKEVIDDFYSSYSAKVYTKKRGSLYNILRIEYDIHEFSYDFDESVMKYRDGSGGKVGDLYTTVFREGYHGGAKVGGTDRYICPTRRNKNGSYVPYDGEDGHPWKNAKTKGQKQGWVPAKKENESPLAAITRMIEYVNNNLAQDFYDETYARIRKEKTEEYL